MSQNSTLSNSQVLECLFAELSKLGINEFCIAAGARNAPIISALYAPESKVTKIYHFFEERCAAFFALGRSMASRKPVAVVTTSGTAAAELLPAVIEAYYQQIPLVLVTADRPSHYRGSGAPQAIEQLPLFDSYLQEKWDIEVKNGQFRAQQEVFKPSEGIFPSFPRHFNVCLEEQVVESASYQVVLPDEDLEFGPSVCSELQAALNEFGSSNLLVLAGAIHPHDAPAVAEFLGRLSAPILAEETSNLARYSALKHLLVLGGEASLKRFSIDRVLRIGGVPSWRWWRDLEDRSEFPVLNLATGAFSGLGRTENVQTFALPARDQWQKLSVSSANSADRELSLVEESLQHLCEKYPQAEPSFLWRISQILPQGSQLFLGNSLTIRYWNKIACGQGIERACFANRGANGIDGLLSTWLGLSENAANSAIVLGDLSALYDLAAPWVNQQLTPANRRVFVMNNNGGKIFSNLHWLKKVSSQTRSAFENSHQLRFEAWAGMWNLEYQRCEKSSELLWREDDAAFKVVELISDDEQTKAFWEDFHLLFA